MKKAYTRYIPIVLFIIVFLLSFFIVGLLLLTGTMMLGATVSSIAADLSDYPNMFLSDGVFDGLMVIGENAAAGDNLAMTDIATSMKYVGNDSKTAIVAVSGDAWLVKSGTDELEFGETVGPASGGVVDFIDGDDLSALADGELTSSKGTFRYEQFLHFDRATINTSYEEDDDGVTTDFMKIADGTQFSRYEMNFLSAAKSDIDASESFKLDDFEDKTLIFMGKTYNIVKARSAQNGPGKVTLTFMSGSEKDTLLEGENKSYLVKGKEYAVNLLFTDSNDRAKFIINGETTPLMEEGDTETLSDGTVLGLSEVLYQDYAGGVHQAEFFLGADKLELEDDDITKTGSSDELKVNDETIDGAEVHIRGAVNDNSTSATDDGELEIDTIFVNMTAQDDYFISAGKTLLGQAELTEKDLVFTQNWDLQYEGLDPSVETDEISIKDKAGEREYWVTFTNVQGQKIEFPLAYVTDATSMRLGAKDDKLFLNKSYIQDEGYFILNDAASKNAISHVVQYKGADNIAVSDPKMKFKILATGETVERPITFGAGEQGATASLDLGGKSYTISNASAGLGGNVANDDWNISVTAGAAATAAVTSNATADILWADYVVTQGGGQISFTDTAASDEVDQILVNISLIDPDRVDDIPNTVALGTPYLVIGGNLTAASTKFDIGSRVGITLTSPDDDGDNSYAYSTNGAWVQLHSPSGGSSADSIIVQWPHELRSPLAYVTSGAVSSSSTAGGEMKAVTFVDATKLDSEVADVKAQNLVVVGGPCVNTAAAELLGNPSDCTEGFIPGNARVKLFEHANGNVAMLVAGYSGADTRLAGKVIANRAGELSGKELVVEGTTYADAKLSKPSAAAPAASE